MRRGGACSLAGRPAGTHPSAAASSMLTCALAQGICMLSLIQQRHGENMHLHLLPVTSPEQMMLSLHKPHCTICASGIPMSGCYSSTLQQRQWGCTELF